MRTTSQWERFLKDWRDNQNTLFSSIRLAEWQENCQWLALGLVNGWTSFWQQFLEGPSGQSFFFFFFLFLFKSLGYIMQVDQCCCLLHTGPSPPVLVLRLVVLTYRTRAWWEFEGGYLGFFASIKDSSVGHSVTQQLCEHHKKYFAPSSKTFYCFRLQLFCISYKDWSKCNT